MPLSTPQVAKLVRQLSSRFKSRAKRAATLLDSFFYPNYGPGPRVITAVESARIDDLHYQALRCSEVLDPLLDALRHGNEFARDYSVTILGHIRDDRALPLLLEALDDDSPAVRKSAAISLGLFFRAITAVPALIGTLDDADPEVGRQAALALGYIRSAEAVAPLTVFYERGDSKSKIAALHAFGSLCDTRTLPLVRAALNHKARVVRKAAKFALSQYDFKRRETLRGTR